MCEEISNDEDRQSALNEEYQVALSELSEAQDLFSQKTNEKNAISENISRSKELLAETKENHKIEILKISNSEEAIASLNNELADLANSINTEKEKLQAKTNEAESLNRQLSILNSEKQKKDSQMSKIDAEIIEKTKAVSELKDDCQFFKSSNEKTQSEFREKQEELSKLRGVYNSLERSKIQNEKIFKNNEDRLNEYNKKIEELKNLISQNQNSVRKKEIEKQNELLNDRRKELKMLERTANSRKSQKTNALSTDVNNLYPKIFEELKVKYSHSVSVSENLTSIAQSELVEMYRRIVRSLNNLAILNIEKYKVELSSNENGLVCNVSLKKSATCNDYEKEVGGFLRLNPFYVLKSWNENDSFVLFSLEIEKGMLRAARNRQPQANT